MSAEDDPTIAALTEYFGPIPATASAELASMLRLYKTSPQDLFFKWESYCLKLDYDADVKISLERVREFKHDTQRMLEAEVRGKRAAAGVGGAGVNITPKKTTAGTKRRSELAPYETPSSKRYAANDGIAPSPLPMKALTISQPPPTPFSQRLAPSSVRDTLNPHLPKPAPPTDPTSWSSRVNLVANFDLKKFSYRPMYQKLYEASEQLDEKIERVQSWVSEMHNIPFDEFSDPSASSPGDVVAVGRICSDSVLDGKLNKASIVLESCRRVGAGSRIPLEFDKLEKIPEPMLKNEGSGICLFPGQIIAVRGVNPNGKFFSVKEILEIPKLPPSAWSRGEIAAMKESCEGGLRIMVASGPFTTHDNLDYEPLTELCQRARATKPDVLILMGPFVDIDHPMVAEGDFDLETGGDDEVLEDEGTLEDLFRQRVSRKIRMVDSNATMVLLIPSTRDAVSKHVAYPQELLSRKKLDLPKNVRSLPNPSMFSLNGTVFATTTTDSLFDLSKTQIVLPYPQSLLDSPQLQDNPIQLQQISTPPSTRAVRNILTQRTFYPVFPPYSHPTTGGTTSISTAVPLDLAYLSLTEAVNILPDILLLPSQVDAFAKIIDGVVAVNPGWVCRPAGYATFAELWIKEKSVEDEDGEEEGAEKEGPQFDEQGEQVFKLKVWERTRVDVMKI